MDRREDVIRAMMDMRPGMSRPDIEEIYENSSVPELLKDALVNAHARTVELAESALTRH